MASLFRRVRVCSNAVIPSNLSENRNHRRYTETHRSRIAATFALKMLGEIPLRQRLLSIRLPHVTSVPNIDAKGNYLPTYICFVTRIKMHPDCFGHQLSTLLHKSTKPPLKVYLTITDPSPPHSPPSRYRGCHRWHSWPQFSSCADTSHARMPAVNAGLRTAVAASWCVSSACVRDSTQVLLMFRAAPALAAHRAVCDVI